MRVKKITPTNEFKHVTFGSLKTRSEAHVYTPMGFQRVLAFDMIKRGKSVRLELSNGEELICDPGHILATKDGPKRVKDLKSNDKLLGYGDSEVSFVLFDGPLVDFYDIEIQAPHWYYTSGILSHNSLMLGNNTIAAMKQGHDVMFVTFELSKMMTGLRLVSSIADAELNKFIRPNVEELNQSELSDLRIRQKAVKKKVLKFKRHDAKLVIYELPPDECSVNDIYAIMDNNRKMKGWQPKVVVLDYLELMLARRKYDNERGDYTRQKAIATELRGLARNENVLIFTATQGNRSSLETGVRHGDQQTAPGHLGLDKAAESFGKAMPVDYVISLNQRECEYRPESGPSIIRLWIAKNRNGPKFESIETNVFYNTMTISEPT